MSELATTRAAVATHPLAAATSVKLLDADASRQGFLVSANADVWLAYGTADAVAGSGHCVRGGAIPFEDNSYRGEVHAISTPGAIVGTTERLLSVGDDQGERQPGADTFAPAGGGDVRPTATLPITGV